MDLLAVVALSALILIFTAWAHRVPGGADRAHVLMHRLPALGLTAGARAAARPS